MKNRSVNILIASFVLIGLFAVMLIVFLDYAKDGFADSITVSSEGRTESTLPVRNLRLNPSESKEYSINLVCAASGGFDVTIDFVEKADGGMKPFVNVTVKCDGELLYEGSLTALLDGDEVIVFEAELHATEPRVISVCYSMPYNIGNEAQGTYSDFDLYVMVEKN